jgi:glycosyltransferase involved in cell wall biosynthesis
MEIDHVSFSSSGGAGLVARNLAETQSQLGHDSNLISFYSKNLHQQPFAKPALTLAAYKDEKLVKSPSTKTMVSLFRNNFHLLRPDSLRDKAILNLHWNQGVISNSSVLSLLESGKPVVWTLHDMAPFTGVCHHNHGCMGFKTDCRSCPEVRPGFRPCVTRNFIEKMVFTRPEPSLSIVTPSHWMAKAAQESAIFGNQKIEVIENPINPAFFQAYSKYEARNRMGIPHDALVGATLATRLDDPGKSVEPLLHQFFSSTKDLGKPARFILFGNGGEKMAANYPGVINLGQVALHEVPKSLIAADFLGSLSIAESAGMTVREAGALGVPSIVFANQGAVEQISHMQDGALLDSSSEFRIVIQKVIEGEFELTKLGARAQQRSWNTSKPEIAATKYLDLYSGLV